MGRRPTPRRRKVVPGDLAVALFSLAMIVLCGLAVRWGLTQAMPEAEERATVPVVSHDSLAATHTHDGEVIRWYVLVDPDTKVEYLVNDRGGCCPRMDRYGKVMGASYVD